MRVAVVTVFPETLAAVTEVGVSGRAVREGILEVAAINPRDFTQDRHRSVDDRPYGGGSRHGDAAGAAASGDRARRGNSVGDAAPRDLPVAAGAAFGRPPGPGTGDLSLAWCWLPGATRASTSGCWRSRSTELSIGDFVLSGGELAALVVIDAVARLLPGVLGHVESAEQDSFADGAAGLPALHAAGGVRRARVCRRCC
jgi:tRNA (guanine37-N1)-methyltransferase